MTALLVLAQIGLAAVLAVAGVAKLADREGSARAAREFGLGRLASAAAVLVPLVELGLAAALVPASSARVAAAAAALLLLWFAVAIAVALARGRRPDCHCFGRLHSSQAGPAALTRNAVLAALAVVVATRPAAHAGWLELTGSGAAALVTAQAIVVYALLRRYGRALRRIEELEAGVEHPAALAAGDAAPDFALPRLDGSEVALRWLLEPARSLLLVFVDPDCGPCHALLPELARWLDDRVTPVFVSRGELDANAVFAEYGEVLLQRERELAELYAADATPSAILIGPDGRIEGPLAIGRSAIEELVGDSTLAPVPPAPSRGVAAAVAAGAAAAAASTAAAGNPPPPADPKLQEIDRILKAAAPRLTTAAKAAATAVRAQATLKTGNAQRAKQVAARKALDAERRMVLALRASLAKLALDAGTSRNAVNARTYAVYALDLFARSLQKQESAIGAKPNVSLVLLKESWTLFLRSLDASAAAAKLLGRVP